MSNADDRTRMKCLEICPYEPPSSGWTKRVKLLRKVIQERGGRCEILDIGPSRKIARPGCIATMNGFDYILKLLKFNVKGFTTHCHVNGEYLRGLYLALAACLIARMCFNRCLVTFHGGTDQLFLGPENSRRFRAIFMAIFRLCHGVICNSESVKRRLLEFQDGSRIFAIPAFSSQYLRFEQVEFGDEGLRHFLASRRPLISSYVCFRDGFFLDVVIEGMAMLVKSWPDLGLILIGTGERLDSFKREIAARDLQRNVYFAGDMSHDSFMTLLSRSDLHLRTPVTDGVSASVLQSLALNIPVVASENGTRPGSVITYRADDSRDFAQRIDLTLRNLPNVVASIPMPEVADTAGIEVNLLAGDGTPAPSSVGPRLSWPEGSQVEK